MPSTVVPEVERRVLVDRRAVGAALADQVGLQAETGEAVQRGAPSSPHGGG